MEQRMDLSVSSAQGQNEDRQLPALRRRSVRKSASLRRSSRGEALSGPDAKRRRAVSRGRGRPAFSVLSKKSNL